MIENLKPCPFKHMSNIDYEIAIVIFDGNGGSKRYEKDEKLFDRENIRVVCGLCDARGPITYSAADAVKEWNRRPKPVVSKMESSEK